MSESSHVQYLFVFFPSLMQKNTWEIIKAVQEVTSKTDERMEMLVQLLHKEFEQYICERELSRTVSFCLISFINIKEYITRNTTEIIQVVQELTSKTDERMKTLVQLLHKGFGQYTDERE